MYFYPLAQENGFDLRKLWLELESNKDLYLFPGSEINADLYKDFEQANKQMNCVGLTSTVLPS